MKKVISFLKSYWYVPVIMLVSLVFVLLKKKDAIDMGEILERSKEKYEEELKVIQEKEKEKKIEIEKIKAKKNKQLAKVEAEFLKNNHYLDDKERKKVKKIVDKHSENPEQIAKSISKKYGYEIVYPKKNSE